MNYKFLLQALNLATAGPYNTNVTPYNTNRTPSNSAKAQPKDWNHTHYFNEHGSIRYAKNEKTVFSCRATNDKNALKKYHAWLEKRKQQ